MYGGDTAKVHFRQYHQPNITNFSDVDKSIA